MSRYQSMQHQAEQWRSRKVQRLQDFNALQVQSLLLHSLQSVPGVPSITFN